MLISFSAMNFFTILLQVGLVLLQLALGLTHEALAVSSENEATSTLHSTSASFAALDATKLVCSIAFLYLERRKDTQNIDYIELESEPLHAEEHRWTSNGNALLSQPASATGTERLTLGSSRSNFAIGALALFLVINSYIVSTSSFLAFFWDLTGLKKDPIRRKLRTSRL